MSDEEVNSAMADQTSRDISTDCPRAGLQPARLVLSFFEGLWGFQDERLPIPNGYIQLTLG